MPQRKPAFPGFPMGREGLEPSADGYETARAFAAVCGYSGFSALGRGFLRVGVCAVCRCLRVLYCHPVATPDCHLGPVVPDSAGEAFHCSQDGSLDAKRDARQENSASRAPAVAIRSGLPPPLRNVAQTGTALQLPALECFGRFFLCFLCLRTSFALRFAVAAALPVGA